MCQQYSPCALEVLGKFFFSEKEQSVIWQGDGTGKAVAAELLTSWKDKLFQSYSVTNKIRSQVIVSVTGKLVMSQMGTSMEHQQHSTAVLALDRQKQHNPTFSMP